MAAKDYHILVVDDEQGARDILSEFLEMLGYQVVTAANGLEALGCIQAYPIDMVISDVNMPRMDGQALMEKLHAEQPDLPILLITGKPSIHAAVESLKNGAVDYINKPFDLNHIRSVVEDQLHGMVETTVEQTTVITDGQRTINGYDVARTVNEGAMGVIYEVWQNGQRYAMKLIRGTPENEEARRELLERFIREAEIASQIQDDHVVQILDFGLSEEELIPYIVMEYVEGIPLSAYQQQLKGRAIEQRTETLCQIASALRAIHQHGICHRDIKPSNILVDAAGMAKLTDFGVARPPESELTIADQILGSPLYMAPESFYSSNVDPRADLFSLGVVAYQFYLDTLPFKGQTLSQIATVITQDRPLNPRKIDPQFPMPLIHILAKLLKKDPKARYQDAEALLTDLRAFLNNNLSIKPLKTITQTVFHERDWG